MLGCRPCGDAGVQAVWCGLHTAQEHDRLLEDGNDGPEGGIHEGKDRLPRARVVVEERESAVHGLHEGNPTHEPVQVARVLEVGIVRVPPPPCGHRHPYGHRRQVDERDIRVLRGGGRGHEASVVG